MTLANPNPNDGQNPISKIKRMLRNQVSGLAAAIFRLRARAAVSKLSTKAAVARIGHLGRQQQYSEALDLARIAIERAPDEDRKFPLSNVLGEFSEYCHVQLVREDNIELHLVTGKPAFEASDKFGVTRLIVEHRLGTLCLGDVSVAVVAAHAHRAPALDANRYVIEELKRRVPIWKLEHYRDGTRDWVGAGSGNREPAFEIPLEESDASLTQDSVAPGS